MVGGARVFLGDCRDVLKSLPDNSVDSIVTDPPYELGFMGKKWDSSGIAYDVTVWEECLRVLKPGGHVLDPFTGSGSTGKAALLDGYQFIGVELTEEYLPIIEGRLRWASEKVEVEDVALF